MKKNILILIFVYYCFNSFSQKYIEEYKTFLRGSSRYEIVNTPDKEGKNDIAKVRIYKNGKIIKEKVLAEKYDTDLIAFGDYVLAERKFILIHARYSFYILNFYNNKLSGPYKPVFYGIGDDSQSSMLTGMKIYQNGKYIYGYCVDSGVFMFDLSNLYKPKEIVSVSYPFTNESKFYALQSKDINKKTLVCLQTESWTVKPKIIFRDKKIEYKNYSGYAELSNKEDLLINDSELCANYTIIKEILPNGYKFLVYDNFSTKRITLEKKVENSTFEKVCKFLEKK